MEEQIKPTLTLEERINAINKSKSIEELTSDILPKSHQEDYYFVSYSHLDYKEVLVDILQMEEQGLHFWYDTDIHIGENWEDIAKSYISKFQCKGVIFYLSKSSINSPACNKEIKYVVDHGINYFSINLPLDEETPICSGK
ncbi:MAG: toll/interleukin-1 receptor domain-containing protein, partial [Clostridia bacterium]|nr:toll/interleukin-1 receptor domain-containing protein [Clostridia bacterium]